MSFSIWNSFQSSSSCAFSKSWEAECGSTEKFCKEALKLLAFYDGYVASYTSGYVRYFKTCLRLTTATNLCGFCWSTNIILCRLRSAINLNRPPIVQSQGIVTHPSMYSGLLSAISFTVDNKLMSPIDEKSYFEKTLYSSSSSGLAADHYRDHRKVVLHQ